MRRYDINKPGGIKVKGVKPGTFSLTEEVYQSSLKRFDPDKYVYDEEANQWCAPEQCTLCKHYGGCVDCPVCQYDCIVLLHRIAGQKAVLVFDATQGGAMPVRMRKGLLKIQAFLKSGKKVR